MLAPDSITVRRTSNYAQNRGFTGYYLDNEISLYYVRTRMASSSLGRFISRTPWMNLDGKHYLSNYSLSSVESSLATIVRGTVLAGQSTYIQSRYNLYDLFQDSPGNFVEPFCTTIVIIGGATASNPFGHVSIAIAGQGVYSFGTGTTLGSNLTDFLKKQQGYRNSMGIEIPTTKEEEKKILDWLKQQKDDIGKYDNCAVRVKKALQVGGITVEEPEKDPFVPYFPKDLLDYLGYFPELNRVSLPQGGNAPPSMGTYNPTP